ncbi:MAG: hypothetical protein ACTIBG_08805 [Brevibacterium aurantiacum]|uniref:hypothetical protein n=1 Tax=Brevibacterium aurantiacum TaxID=273384 RepID=UPI003F8EC72C
MSDNPVHFTGSALKWQQVLNSLSARDRPARAKIPVRARLVWEHDGKEWKNGSALRLDPAGLAIFVELQDKRCKFAGVWLHPDDVWWAGKPARACLL